MIKQGVLINKHSDPSGRNTQSNQPTNIMSFTESQKQILGMLQNSQELTAKQLALLSKGLDFFNPDSTTVYRSGSLWTPLEDAFLVLYAHKINVFDAAKVLGRTENAVMTRLIKIVLYNLPRRFHDGMFFRKAFGLPNGVFYSLYSKAVAGLNALKKKPKVPISVALIKTNVTLKGYYISVVQVMEQPTKDSGDEGSDNESDSEVSSDVSIDTASDSDTTGSSDSDSSDSESGSAMSVDSDDSESDAESDFSIIA